MNMCSPSNELNLISIHYMKVAHSNQTHAIWYFLGILK
jgi:hypothetical protein